MPRVVAVAPVLPPHRYPQQQITGTIGPLLTSSAAGLRALARLHAASGVRTRHLVLPLEEYAGLRSFGAANDHFVRLGTDLAEQAVKTALSTSGIDPAEVDFLMFTSVTGISAPSVDAALVTRLGMRPDVTRLPSFGLGCAGGAAGLGRLHDHLVGHPHHIALLVSVELCSLTVQHGDDSPANLVSSGLFGDGAAAVVMVGDAVPTDGRTWQGPRVVAAASRLSAGTEGDLGWRVADSGFRIVLAPGLPGVIEGGLAPMVAALLEEHDVPREEVAAWVVHAGGPKILDAVRTALDLDESALATSRECLARVGNLSSASVLHVLAAEAVAEHPPGSAGVLMAFGPGVSTDLVLLRWPGEG